MVGERVSEWEGAISNINLHFTWLNIFSLTEKKKRKNHIKFFSSASSCSRDGET